MNLYSIEDAKKLEEHYNGVLLGVSTLECGRVEPCPIENGKYAVLFTGIIYGRAYIKEDVCNIAAALTFTAPEKVLKESTCK
ncbi:hypothetical protein [Ferruginibacter sp.]|uniref:hypothetical protein n=1 Tax=Ferruginibacter sp. TaxID=1940288 RepID=UPI00374CCE1D